MNRRTHLLPVFAIAVALAGCTLGGQVTGLDGTITLEEAASGESLAVSQAGPFAFSGRFLAGQAYDVAITQQPVADKHRCSVTGGTGTYGFSDVTDVAVDCFHEHYFVGDDGVHGRELWETRGSAEATLLVKDMRPGSNGTSFSNGYYWTTLDKVVYFAADDGVHGQELWKTDGTSGNTVQVKDISPGAGSSRPKNLTVSNGILYFMADDGSTGYQLWRTDGTDQGTSKVRPFGPQVDNNNPSVTWHSLADLNGLLYFTADDGTHGYELWVTDGSAANTRMVKDINPNMGVYNHRGAYPSKLTRVNDVIYFRARDGQHGYELWKTDGTAAGTTLVKDIVPGQIMPGFGNSSDIEQLTPLGNILLFSVDDDVNGRELWRSDGTSAGTVMVKDIFPGTRPGTYPARPYGSHPASLTPVAGTIYFTATDSLVAHGQELWKSDGTAGGTVLVSDIRPGSSSSLPAGLKAFNADLLFAADDGVHGREVWISDGTAAGTVMVKDINPGAGPGTYQDFAVLGGIAVFHGNDGVHGRELWRTDGTPGGTYMLKDINPGPGNS